MKMRNTLHFSMLAGPFKQTEVGGGIKLQSLIKIFVNYDLKKFYALHTTCFLTPFMSTPSSKSCWTTCCRSFLTAVKRSFCQGIKLFF